MRPVEQSGALSLVQIIEILSSHWWTLDTLLCCCQGLSHNNTTQTEKGFLALLVSCDKRADIIVSNIWISVLIMSVPLLHTIHSEV